MLKFFAKRRRRKGFTLTEMIVVTAIIAIIMAAIASFAGPVRTLLHNSTAKSDALTINNVMGNYIERRLAYANYMNIYVGPTSLEYDKMENSFDSIKALASNANQKNNARVMIFKFIDENAPDPITDPLSYTYKVYDVPVTKDTDFPTGFDDLSSWCDDDDYGLYTDNFYNNYQYFMTIDMPRTWDPVAKTDSETLSNANKNAVKNRVYINMRIDAYKFEGNTVESGTEIGLTEGSITAYHQYIDEYNINHNTATVNPFDKYAYEKIGTENISFSLENISNASNVKYVRGHIPTGGSTATYGKDIYIFYNVRTYDIANDK